MSRGVQSYANGSVADGGSGEHQSRLRSMAILEVARAHTHTLS